MLSNLIVCLGGLLLLVAWVGWRYFIASPSPVTLRPATGAHRGDAIADKPVVLPSRPLARRRFDLARLRLLTHWSLWFALLLVGLSAAGVSALSGRILLDPLSAPGLIRQQHIQSALSPEKLVPPPALPPSVFVGSDQPGLETADRDWARLNPDFVQTVLTVFARMEARGYPLVLLEGYRSPERQDTLADSRIPVTVTNARAFQSKHQYGLAADVALLRDGRLVISERDPWAMQAYQVLGEEAEKAGLIWGGRWKLRDFGHIEAAGTSGFALRGK